METILNDNTTWGAEAGKINSNTAKSAMAISKIEHFDGMTFNPSMKLNTESYWEYDIVRASYRSCQFTVIPGISYTIAGSFNSFVPSIIFYDNFGKHISTTQITSGTNTTTITAPAAAKTCIVNIYNSNCSVTVNGSAEVEGVEKTIASTYMSGYDFSNYYNCRNAASSNITLDYGLSSIGAIQSQGSSRVYLTDYIFIPKGYALKYKIYISSTSSHSALYDRDKVFISSITQVQTGFNSGSIIGDNNYVRFTTDKYYGLSTWFESNISEKEITDGFKIGDVELFELAKNNYYAENVNIAKAFSASEVTDENMISPYALFFSGISVNPSSDTMTTDYLPIGNGDYKIRYRSAGNYGVQIYDKYKRYIRGWDCNLNKIEGWTSLGGSFSITDYREAFIRITGYADTPIELKAVRTISVERPSFFRSVNYKKKIVTLGDSISVGKNWQKYLKEVAEISWDETENSLGSGTHWELPDGTRLDAYEDGAIEMPNPPMAISGTTVKNFFITDQSDWASPVWEAGYERCNIASRARYAKYYNPDIIIIWAGANDHGFINTPAIWGTVNDTPYIGDGVQVAYSSDPVGPTVYASYMGMLQTLCQDLPNAKILCLSLAPWRFDTEQTAADYDMIEKTVNTMIKECAEKYKVEYVDLYNNLGWNYFNNVANYSVPTGNREVHPNDIGQMKVVEYLSKII